MNNDTKSNPFPIEDWRYEVANGDTLLGYEEWVAHKREADAEPCDECSGTRWPDEVHDDHCSLNPKNTAG
jgi:hypothetical protein